MSDFVSDYAPKKWELPDNYYGEKHYGSFVFLGQNRDSDVVTRSNFLAAQDYFDEKGFPYEIIRERHWACGWLEWIKITNSDTLYSANKLAQRLEDYPVLDEDRLSQLEWDEFLEMEDD